MRGTGLRLDGSNQSWEEARLLAASWSEGSRTGGDWDGIDGPRLKPEDLQNTVRQAVWGVRESLGG